MTDDPKRSTQVDVYSRTGHPGAGGFAQRERSWKHADPPHDSKTLQMFSSHIKSIRVTAAEHSNCVPPHFEPLRYCILATDTALMGYSSHGDLADNINEASGFNTLMF